MQPSDQQQASQQSKRTSPPISGTVQGEHVEINGGGAAAIISQGNMSVRGGGGAVLISGGNTEIQGGGAAVIISGGETEIEQGGSALVIASEAEIEQGFVGIILSGETKLEEGSRVLLDTPRALALGTALGATFALLSWLLRRR
ncbi:hypothetical protein Tter_2231 [Thermobaculum terrenum ATCC BAA-798]|uniref:Uncharacterized protein n=1 Tax=Thermobaculum terrenum (strain ATCC BAA-798 / CCMEE 7001 / YNP1) TaxID=525904 RepID=D1CHA9_THET1|nr:hypothetical protein [Thermobaculum terrenum]ACZ43130.1 hypothetical protein Tter_2231 [Thermobaculum terrenum ATCC BAA-798]